MNAEKAFITYWDDAPMPEPGETQARDVAEAAFMAGRRSTCAPELLAACRLALGSVRHANHCKAPMAFPCSCDANVIDATLREAIAKARGE